MKITRPPKPRPQFPPRPNGKTTNATGVPLGPYNWSGTFGGKFTFPGLEPGPVPIVFKLGWRHFWRRYYYKCNIDNINIDVIDAETVSTTADFEGVGEMTTDNIFGRIWKTMKEG